MAVLAPILALWIRDPDALTSIAKSTLAAYVGISAFFSIWFFMLFRVAHGFPSFFSFHDAIQIGKASLCTVTATAAVAFATTRLELIPRSVPAIHFLVLVALLASGRLLRRVLVQHRELHPAVNVSHEKEQNVILVGAGRLTWFYVRFLDSFPVGNRRIAAILDDGRWMHGRSIYGHVIVGGSQEASALLDDFEQHGMDISAVVICEQDFDRAMEYRDRLAPLCRARGLHLELLAERLGVFHALEGAAREPRTVSTLHLNTRYFRIKRALDAAMATAGLILCIPLFALTALLVLVSMGSPIIFWQRRVGRDGLPIYVYKFKTMRNPVDRKGRVLSSRERSTHVGRVLRATRLDELPQLINVIKGEMSLVGPRPLLAIDQPSESSVRLAVAPGLTGWAQIHGGKLVTVDEKNALDEWYVRNACFRLDAKIIWRTFAIVVIGDQRNEEQLSEALARAMADKGRLPPPPQTTRRRNEFSNSGERSRCAVQTSLASKRRRSLPSIGAAKDIGGS